MMDVLRNIFGVIAGYLIFAVSAVMLFRLGRIDPHAEAGWGTLAGVILVGAIFGTAGGYVAKLIASTKSLAVNVVLALIMAGFAVVSLFMSTGSHYAQVAAIFLFAPLSLLGGILRRRSELK